MGMNCPPWVTEFKVTGWEFATAYEGVTSLERKVRSNQILGTREREDYYPVGTGGTSPYRYVLDGSEYFSETVKSTQRMHNQYPKTKFLVYGWDGLKDYYYYAEGFHLRVKGDART